MSRALFAGLLGIVAVLAGVPLASAQSPVVERRLALVIGESAYPAAALPTAANDAGLVARTLQAAGFEVLGARDLDGDVIRRVFRDFLQRAEAAGPSGVVVIYLSGYGLQYAGENYFMPLDAAVVRDTDIPVDGLLLSDYMRQIARMPLRASVLVFDIARRQPFVPEQLAAGLRQVESPGPRTLVAFNAAPETVAADRPGPYGAYALALSGMIRDSGMTLSQMFSRVRREVVEATHGRQTPWDTQRFEAEFTFSEPGAGSRRADQVALTAPPPPEVSTEPFVLPLPAVEPSSAGASVLPGSTSPAGRVARPGDGGAVVAAAPAGSISLPPAAAQRALLVRQGRAGTPPSVFRVTSPAPQLSSPLSATPVPARQPASPASGHEATGAIVAGPPDPKPTGAALPPVSQPQAEGVAPASIAATPAAAGSAGQQEATAGSPRAGAEVESAAVPLTLVGPSTRRPPKPRAGVSSAMAVPGTPPAPPRADASARPAKRAPAVAGAPERQGYRPASVSPDARPAAAVRSAPKPQPAGVAAAAPRLASAKPKPAPRPDGGQTGRKSCPPGQSSC